MEVAIVAILGGILGLVLILALVMLFLVVREGGLPAAPSAAHFGLGIRVGLKLKEEVSMKALALNDRQFSEITILPPFVDQDGQEIKDGEGNAFVPAVAISSADESIAGAALAGPLSAKISSGLVGATEVTLSVGPFPDGTVVEEKIAVAVGNSAPGPLNIEIGAPQDES